MGFLDDMFNLGGPKQPEAPKGSGGLLDSLFNFGAPSGGATPSSSSGGLFSGGGLFTSGRQEPAGGPFSYGEPILPGHTQAMGYGGQYFGSVGEADKSRLIDGVVTDPHTGYVGTPSEIYDRYVAEGRDPSPLVRLFHRRGI